MIFVLTLNEFNSFIQPGIELIVITLSNHFVYGQRRQKFQKKIIIGMWVYVSLFKIHILHLFHPVFCVRCLLDLLRKHFLFQSLPFLLRLENVDREKELLNGTFFISSFDLCCKFLTVFFLGGVG